MTTITRHIDSGGLEDLRGLEGAIWEGYGSTWPTANGFLESPAFLVTNSCKLSIGTATEYFDIDGDVFSFSSVQISEAGSELDRARNEGNVYYQNKGEQINQVLIVRETLRATYEGNPFFEVDFDFGIVLVRSKSVIAIAKRGFHGDDFVVSSAPSIGELELFDSSKEWSQSLMMDYEFGRELIKIDDLLKG